MEKKHIGFIDVLGFRRLLALGQSSIAEKKITSLARIVDEVIPTYSGVFAHGTTDFFVLWSADQQAGWRTALAARKIFQEYFDLNEKENVKDIQSAFLLRGGLAYGEVGEFVRANKQVTYSMLLGDGLAKAYEMQISQKGMRLLLAPGASSAFKPSVQEEGLAELNIKIDKHLKPNGAFDYSEIRWGGYGKEVDLRIERASKLFRDALHSFRKKEVSEDIVLHYQQTLSAIIGCCGSPELLLPYTIYLHRRHRAHQFLGPIWTTAWRKLFRPKYSDFLRDNRHKIYEYFLIMSGTPMISEVSRTLSRYNSWRPLIRFLKDDKLRFGSKKRKS